MIKVYSLQKGIPILNAKFSEQYLRENGIVSTDHILSADLFLTQSTKLKSYKIINTIFPFKKRIVWTNEPRYNQTTDNFITDNQAIMNVYSGDVFLHNLHFLGSYHNDFSVDLGINIKNPPSQALTLKKLQEKKKFCIAVFSYRNPQTSKLIVNGKDIDLYTLRQDMASYFFEKNKTDIVGGKWPSNIKTHESSGFESGNQHWWVRKLDLLKDYKFNICL
ncbi:MAG TPA: hypothetical protein VHZ50_06770, partial [Puia sp.]|nr:hypothetical protein [Puia sp.]